MKKVQFQKGFQITYLKHKIKNQRFSLNLFKHKAAPNVR